jgi:hypothetical protein
MNSQRNVMPSRKATIVAVLGILLAPLVAEGQGKSPEKTSVRFEQKSIVVEGVNPGREILLFGVWHQPIPHSTSVRRWDRIAADEDRDGKVVFTFDADIPFRSIWAAVDMHGGEFVVASPEGFDLRTNPLPGGAMKKAGDDVVALDFESYSADWLVVRGGAGAWRYDARQNDPLTDESPDGSVIRVDPAKFTAVAGKAPAPKVLTPGDLILLIDPFELNFYFAKVGR